jgi:S-adenosylmethionine:diacylglycerol 3-amino-3-carboxypropyl transferase
MAFDTVMEVPRNGNLVGRAMHRNSFLSVESAGAGFSFAFRGLVYPQIWEDPGCDMAAMEIKPTITSSPSPLAGAMC